MQSAKRFPRWTHLRPLLTVAVVTVATGCAGAVRIEQLLDDPTAYDGRDVRVQGEVSQAIGVALVGGTYEVNDGTGSLRVVNEGGSVPRDGAEVSVVGTFRALFTIGAESLAVLEERNREVR